MGIPRLTQDLSPYARLVSIGHIYTEHDLPVIDMVVIDGPALVHYIYAQVAREGQKGGSTAIGQPTYRLICSRVKEFLTTLQNCNVTMCPDECSIPCTCELTETDKQSISMVLCQSKSVRNVSGDSSKHDRNWRPFDKVAQAHSRSRLIQIVRVLGAMSHLYRLLRDETMSGR